MKSSGKGGREQNRRQALDVLPAEPAKLCGKEKARARKKPGATKSWV